MATSTKGITLRHEIFVLDANLTAALDQSQCESHTRSLVSELLRSLGMFELGPLQIYQALDLRAPGWSFVQPITTSHIASHYFEKPGKYPNFHMDIYSCKPVDWRKVIEVMNKHHKLRDWRANYIQRNMKSEKREVWEIAGNGVEIHEVSLVHPQSEELPRKMTKGLTAKAFMLRS